MEDFVEIQIATGIIIRRLRDGAFIPVDEGNRDYQAYLEWKYSQNG